MQMCVVEEHQTFRQSSLLLSLLVITTVNTVIYSDIAALEQK